MSTGATITVISGLRVSRSVQKPLPQIRAGRELLSEEVYPAYLQHIELHINWYGNRSVLPKIDHRVIDRQEIRISPSGEFEGERFAEVIGMERIVHKYDPDTVPLDRFSEIQRDRSYPPATLDVNLEHAVSVQEHVQ